MGENASVVAGLEQLVAADPLRERLRGSLPTQPDGGIHLIARAWAHQRDLEVQERYGVEYRRYWFDEGSGKVFCLVAAPDADAATAVHREAHGLVADQVIPVTEGR